MRKSIADHSLAELKNVVENHRRHGQFYEPYFLDALEELSRRKGNGLNFQTSLNLIRTAAADGRFLSYKELADASGADWSKVRYAVNKHLGDLLDYAHGRRLPLLALLSSTSLTLRQGKWTRRH